MHSWGNKSIYQISKKATEIPRHINSMFWLISSFNVCFKRIYSSLHLKLCFGSHFVLFAVCVSSFYWPIQSVTQSLIVYSLLQAPKWKFWYIVGTPWVFILHTQIYWTSSNWIRSIIFFRKKVLFSRKRTFNIFIIFLPLSSLSTSVWQYGAIYIFFTERERLQKWFFSSNAWETHKI